MTEEQALVALQAREPLFHREEFGGSRAAFAASITDSFWEVGASGRVYLREFVLEELDRRLLDPQPEHWETREFACRELAPGLYLLTYVLVQEVCGGHGGRRFGGTPGWAGRRSTTRVR